MSEQLFFALVACAIMLLVGFPVHEFFHAYTAYRLGDSTARYQGRLTLNPVVHFDMFGGFLLIITAVLSGGSAFFGFAKPTPVNPMNLRGGRRGQALVAAAGPLSNLVMAAIVAVPLRIIFTTGVLGDAADTQIVSGLLNIAFYFIVINLSLFIFNFIPVPPLDGFSVLIGLVDSRTAWQLRQFTARYAAFIPFAFLAVFYLGGAAIIAPVRDFFLNILLGTG